MKHAGQTGLEQALELSRCLLQLVNDEAWEEAAKIEAERYRLLRQSAHADASEPLTLQVELLREIALLDREIVGVSRQKRADLSRRLQDLHQGKKAGRAYGEGLK